MRDCGILGTKELNLLATAEREVAFKDAQFVIISTPTNYDPDQNYFDTTTVETVINDVMAINPDATVVLSRWFRLDASLRDVKEKVYTRDLFSRD